MKLTGWLPELHYPMLADWWRGHGMTPIPRDLIPCYGVIVTDDEGVPRCAGFFSYDPINRLSNLDWLCSNPAHALSLRYAVALYSKLAEMARALGAKVMWAQAFDERMARACERVGFVESGRNAVTLRHDFRDLE